MTAASPTPGNRRDWHSAFSAIELDALQAGIPAGIQAAQARTGRANTEYADPEGELDVYGVGMSKAAPKEIRALLRDLPSYREVPIPKTSRQLMFVGRNLIFPIRVGDKMRRNRKQLWLRSFSQTRQDYFAANSTQRREASDPTLFDIEPSKPSTVEGTHIEDALRQVEQDAGRSELFVPFFSSTPLGVGQIMWAPARLDGRYLRFFEPETLTYRRMQSLAVTSRNRLQVADGFADSPRPRTTVKRRRLPNNPTEQTQ
ncbi:hypothetical protein ANMWB30_42770 [Arthrobacter sp. MWB30]|nr:hypothetical protein ANMWB30_42770 [Arthrobacter sp. MWB30]